MPRLLRHLRYVEPDEITHAFALAIAYRGTHGDTDVVAHIVTNHWPVNVAHSVSDLIPEHTPHHSAYYVTDSTTK
jgi:hypothetical protein